MGLENGFPALSIETKLRDGIFVPDELKKKYGPVTATIWGEVFRFTQMKDAVCKASMDTIAELCGVSRRTVINHLEILCKDGYAIDTTPGIVNQPHEYVLTNKIKFNFQTEVKYKSDFEQTPEELWNA